MGALRRRSTAGFARALTVCAIAVLAPSAGFATEFVCTTPFVPRAFKSLDDFRGMAEVRGIGVVIATRDGLELIRDDGSRPVSEKLATADGEVFDRAENLVGGGLVLGGSTGAWLLTGRNGKVERQRIGSIDTVPTFMRAVSGLGVVVGKDRAIYVIHTVDGQPVIQALEGLRVGARTLVDALPTMGALLQTDDETYLLRKSDNRVRVTATGKALLGDVRDHFVISEHLAILQAESGLFMVVDDDRGARILRVGDRVGTISKVLPSDAGMVIHSERGLFVLGGKKGQVAMVPVDLPDGTAVTRTARLSDGTFLAMGAHRIFAFRTHDGTIAVSELVMPVAGEITAVESLEGAGMLIVAGGHLYSTVVDGSRVVLESLGTIDSVVPSTSAFVGRFADGSLVLRGDGPLRRVVVERGKARIKTIDGLDARDIIDFVSLSDVVALATARGLLTARVVDGRTTIDAFRTAETGPILWARSIPGNVIDPSGVPAKLGESGLLIGAERGTFLVGRRGGVLGLDRVGPSGLSPARWTIGIADVGTYVQAESDARRGAARDDTHAGGDQSESSVR